MKIVRNIEELHTARNAFVGGVSYVPTMGALHAGHLSLVALAKSKAEHVVVSIFVNPTQFAPHEDLDSYPRDEEKDAQMLRTAGVDILFLPSEDVLYPDGHATHYETGDAAQGLETDFRPHFFGGVINVVSRLFNAIHPDIAIFGEKDYQQLQVIREMVDHYDMGVEIIGAPIARDEYGLALSSRNAYLSVDELDVARKLNIILRDTATSEDTEAAISKLLDAGFDKVDYVAKRWERVLAAAYIGKTRLIDNIAVK
ncbi:MAG: pantoate--beta-alanine ligase [Alphaproteobacteria bacterium]